MPWEEPDLIGRHEVTVTHVPPGKDYQLTIVMIDTEARTTPPEYAVRTLPAPPGWIALSRGAQNLRAVFNADQLIVTWDLPFPDASPTFWLHVMDADTGRTLYRRFAHDITNWEVPLTRLLRSASQYRIVVAHNDILPTTAEIVVARQEALRSTDSESAESRPDATLIDCGAETIPCLFLSGPFQLMRITP